MIFFLSPSDQRNYGFDDNNLTFENIENQLAAHDIPVHQQIVFYVCYTHNEVEHSVILQSRGISLSIPHDATDRRLLWGCNIELDGKSCLYLSLKTVQSFIATTMRLRSIDSENYTLVDAHTKLAPVISLETPVTKLKSLALRNSYSYLTLVQIVPRILLYCPGSHTVDPAGSSASNSSSSSSSSSSTKARRVDFIGPTLNDLQLRTLLGGTTSTGRLRTAVDDYIAAQSLQKVGCLKSPMFTSQSSSDQASEIASVGSLHGLQVVTGQPCADTSTWKITEWEEWLNHIKFHLDGFHAAYIPALEHPEAPRRSITDPLVIGALNCFATDRGNQATYSIETELYNQATVPKHTIGWGPLDYLLESRVVLCESVQECTSNDDEEAETNDPDVASDTKAELSSTIIETKRTIKLNDNAVAQTIAQAVDLLDKKKGGPDVKYPLVVYAILSTGQRYLVFTVAYYTAEAEKPVLLYHGLESLHVLPYLGSIEDPNNSGLLVGKKVNRDEVERVMATISVCLHGSIDISCNFQS